MREHDPARRPTPAPTPAEFPVTERLMLRAHRPSDFDACAAMWADPIVTRYIGGKVFTREETWSKILRYAGLWSLLGYGYWAIEERATNRFVGEIGFANFQRAIDADVANFPEIGWALSPSVHNRGYATEALRAALSWADTHLRAPQTFCLIAPENLASIRLACKNDYRESGLIAYKGSPMLIFERPSAGDAPLPSTNEP